MRGFDEESLPTEPRNILWDRKLFPLPVHAKNFYRACALYSQISVFIIIAFAAEFTLMLYQIIESFEEWPLLSLPQRLHLTLSPKDNPVGRPGTIDINLVLA